MTRPVGRAALEIIGDASKLAASIERELNRALRALKFDIQPAADRLARELSRGIEGVQPAFHDLEGVAAATFQDMAADAALAAGRIGQEFKAGSQTAAVALGGIGEAAALPAGRIVAAFGAAGAAVTRSLGGISGVAALTSLRSAGSFIAAAAAIRRAMFDAAEATGLAFTAAAGRAITAVAVIRAALLSLSGEAVSGRALAAIGSAAIPAAGRVATAFRTASESVQRSLREAGRVAGTVFAEMVAQADAAAVGIGNKIGSAAKTVAGHMRTLGIALVAGLGALAGFGLKAAANLEQVQVGMTALLGSAEQAKGFMKELAAFSQATPFEFKDVADASRRILAFGQSVGITRQQVIPTLTSIGDLVAVLGGTKESVESVVRALGQMASKGKVSQEEMLQLAEALPGFNVNAALASQLGLTVGESLQRITAGAVDGKTGVNALIAAMAAFPNAAGAMEQQSKTLLGVFSNFKDVITFRLSDAFSAVIPQIKSALLQITPVVGEALDTLVPSLAGFIANILPVAADLAKAFAPVAGILLDIAGSAAVGLTPALEALGVVLHELADTIKPFAAELGTALGDLIIALIPVLEELLPEIKDLIPAFIDFLHAITPILPDLGEMLALTIQLQRPLIQITAALSSFSSLNFVAPLIRGISGALGSLLSFAKPIAGFDSNIRNWPKLFDGVGDKVGKAFSGIGSAIGGFLGGVGPKIGKFFSDLPGQIGRAMAKIPGILLDTLVTGLGNTLRGVGVVVGLILAAIIGIPKLIVFEWTKLPGIVSDFMRDMFNKALTIVTTKGVELLLFFRDLPLKIGLFLVTVVPTIAGAFRDAFKAANTFVLIHGAQILAYIGSIPGRIGQFAVKMLNAGVDFIKSFFTGMSHSSSVVGDIVGAIVRGLKSGLNFVVDRINEGIDFVGRVLPFPLPHIPRLARGGITTNEGVAVLHPNEAVLPLEDRRVTDLLARALAEAQSNLRTAGVAPAQTSGGPMNIRIFVGTREITDIIRIEMDERDRELDHLISAGPRA